MAPIRPQPAQTVVRPKPTVAKPPVSRPTIGPAIGTAKPGIGSTGPSSVRPPQPPAGKPGGMIDTKPPAGTNYTIPSIPVLNDNGSFTPAPVSGSAGLGKPVFLLPAVTGPKPELPPSYHPSQDFEDDGPSLPAPPSTVKPKPELPPSYHPSQDFDDNGPYLPAPPSVVKPSIGISVRPDLEIKPGSPKPINNAPAGFVPN